MNPHTTHTSITLTPDDQRILDAIAEGCCAPGELAKRLGLSTLALIDRLLSPTLAAAIEALHSVTDLLQRQGVRLREIAALDALAATLSVAGSPTEIRRAATAILRFSVGRPGRTGAAPAPTSSQLHPRTRPGAAAEQSGDDDGHTPVSMVRSRLEAVRTLEETSAALAQLEKLRTEIKSTPPEVLAALAADPPKYFQRPQNSASVAPAQRALPETAGTLLARAGAA
ncbi:MAG: hypothetical protein ACREJO_13360 [Phycisphaerales bacterium]